MNDGLDKEKDDNKSQEADIQSCTHTWWPNEHARDSAHHKEAKKKKGFSQRAEYFALNSRFLNKDDAVRLPA